MDAFDCANDYCSPSWFSFTMGIVLSLLCKILGLPHNNISPTRLQIQHTNFKEILPSAIFKACFRTICQVIGSSSNSCQNCSL
uniref:Uncharacterized protein n=1 Tax=Arundo donax TaxID=35708 RepID=A0A0A9F523_ARUDO